MKGAFRVWVRRVLPVLVGCGGGPKVVTDYDPGQLSAIRSYSSYAWMPGTADNSTIGTIVVNRIQTSVDRELQAKGYTRRFAGDVDFRVAWHITTQRRAQLETVGDAYRGGRWASTTAGPPTSADDEPLRVGALLIDIVDGASNDLVWRGLAQGEIGNERDPAKRQDKIEAGIRKMFARFPPENQRR